MSPLRNKTAQIRRFILDNVAAHPGDIARLTAEAFGISRQAVGRHLARLVAEGTLSQTGRTRGRRYRLRQLVEWEHSYSITPGLEEDVVWRNDAAPLLKPMPDNAFGIWSYAFSEMFNNAIDHSGGSRVTVRVKHTAEETEIAIHDDGVGIFFSSRMFDSFGILSGTTCFSHEFRDDQDWIRQSDIPEPGTTVRMRLNNHTALTAKQVFDQFSSGDDYGFTRTVVPVRLARYGDELLVSRSQARRLLARVDRFQVVVFDFEDVGAIGQSFADELFRVFARQHPDVELQTENASDEVMQMIRRAQAAGTAGTE